MTHREARSIAARHIARLGIPARIDRVVVQITTYDDEDTLRFMKDDEPEITLASQRLLNEAFADEMRRRGALIQWVPVVVDDYFAWLGRFQLDNTNHNRAQYITWLTAPEP